MKIYFLINGDDDKKIQINEEEREYLLNLISLRLITDSKIIITVGETLDINGDLCVLDESYKQLKKYLKQNKRV